MTRTWKVLLAGALLCSPAYADQAPPVIGIMTGMPTGVYMATAYNLDVVLGGKDLRIIPEVGKGSLQNLDDLLHTRGVDIAFCQADALGYAKLHPEAIQANLAAGELNKIEYVAKLYNEELHIVAGPEIKSTTDLVGKRVNVDVQGSGSAMTSELVLRLLGVPANVSHYPQAIAVKMLETGKLDALMHVGGAPIPLFTDLTAGQFHFVPLRYTQAFDGSYYLPDQLTHAEYPNLVNAPVPTISVADVMAVYGFPQSSQRYKHTAMFVDALFNHFSELLQPPNHPKWREVNLAASVPGWIRFPEAQADIDKVREERDFGSFLESKLPEDVKPSRDVQEKLFQEFLVWQQQQHAAIDVHVGQR